MSDFHLNKLACAALALALSVPLMAAEEAAPAPASDWTLPMSVSFVSDYIFRGQSQTWGRPALQFSIEAVHVSGFYGGFFASNVSDHWLPGASIETDFYGGYRGKLSEVAYDLGVVYYVYPGGDWKESGFPNTPKNKLDTAEAYVSFNYQWLTFKTGINLTEYYGWTKANSGLNGGFNGDLGAGVKGDTQGSHFFELNASYDVAEGWNLNGQIGRQRIRNSTGLDLTYYKIGLTKTLSDGWSAGAFFSATSEPDAYKDFLSLDNTHSRSDIAKDKLFVSVTKAF